MRLRRSQHLLGVTPQTPAGESLAPLASPRPLSRIVSTGQFRQMTVITVTP